jgi:hypothetical protein
MAIELADLSPRALTDLTQALEHPGALCLLAVLNAPT